MSTLSEALIEFDHALAAPVYPRPIPKNAPLIALPRTLSGTPIPMSILSSWGEPQVFQEDFRVIAAHGHVTHGAAETAWRAMYDEVAPGSGYWVKTTPPTGYRLDRAGVVTTYAPSPIGAVLESRLPVRPGDWIIRQPAGEVQRVSAQKFPTLYFSPAEAAELGLPGMAPAEFKAWVLREAAQALAELFAAAASLSAAETVR